MLMHIVKAGLNDHDLQQKCTYNALLNDVENISNLIEFCSAQESGKIGQESTIIALKSTYQKEKRTPALSRTLKETLDLVPTHVDTAQDHPTKETIGKPELPTAPHSESHATNAANKTIMPKPVQVENPIQIRLK